VTNLNARERSTAAKLAESHDAKTLGSMLMDEPDARKRDVLAWAVYLRTEDDRKAAGTWVSAPGYSGRQTNRR